jgi:5'(3')-deoxyribonucleotidase
VYPFNLALAQFLELQGRIGPMGYESQAGFSATPRKYGALLTSEESYPVPTTWDFWEEWGMTKGDWMMAFRRGVEYGHIWTEEEPIEGAIDGLWRLSDAEYHIRLVTHRLNHPFGHRAALKSTADWLDKYAVPYRSVSFIGPESKRNYRGAGILIDDSPVNLADWSEVGVGVIFDQPWNQDVEEHSSLTRAVGWDEVVDAVNEINDVQGARYVE